MIHVKHIILVMMLAITTSVMAFDTDYGYINLKGTVTSSYLYRGITVGGPSIQTSFEGNVSGAELDVWANIGSDSYRFNSFVGELDIVVRYNANRIDAGAKYIYFYIYNKGNYKIDLFANYNILKFLDDDKLTFGWSSYILGGDYSLDGKRAYSSYINMVYSHSFDFGLTCSAELGFTPWTSIYTNYNGNFAFVNISISATYELVFGNIHVSPFAEIMLNPYCLENNSGSKDWNRYNSGNFAIGASVSL